MMGGGGAGRMGGAPVMVMNQKVRFAGSGAAQLCAAKNSSDVCSGSGALTSWCSSARAGPT